MDNMLQGFLMGIVLSKIFTNEDQSNKQMETAEVEADADTARKSRKREETSKGVIKYAAN